LKSYVSFTGDRMLNATSEGAKLRPLSWPRRVSAGASIQIYASCPGPYRGHMSVSVRFRGGDGPDPDRRLAEREPVLPDGDRARSLRRLGPGPGVGPDRSARAGPGRLVRHRGRREGRPVRHPHEEGEAGLRVAGAGPAVRDCVDLRSPEFILHSFRNGFLEKYGCITVP
jgi:hypothetical protein